MTEREANKREMVTDTSIPYFKQEPATDKTEGAAKHLLCYSCQL